MPENNRENKGCVAPPDLCRIDNSWYLNVVCGLIGYDFKNWCMKNILIINSSKETMLLLEKWLERKAYNVKFTTHLERSSSDHRRICSTTYHNRYWSERSNTCYKKLWWLTASLANDGIYLPWYLFRFACWWYYRKAIQPWIIREKSWSVDDKCCRIMIETL